MAIDKAVDSGVLDTALTYTAGRIRAKTGSADQIAWDATKGFGDAVDGIQAGASTDYFKQRLAVSMTEYVDNESTKAGPYSFAGQAQLTTVSMPEVTDIWQYCFIDCTKLTSIYFPKLVLLRYQAFRNCSSLTEFVSGGSFNSRIDSSTFEGCTSLTKADFKHINSQQGFGGYSLACANLVTLIIRNADAVPPASHSIFGGNTTKMNKGEGYIYVPASMVDAYKAATNWSKYADQIRAIEDYPDITGG